MEKWLDIGAALFALVASVFWFLSAYGKIPPIIAYWGMTQRCRPRNVSRSCRRTGYHHRSLANVLFWFQDHLLHIPRQDISSHVPLSLDVSSIASSNRVRHRICDDLTGRPHLPLSRT